MSYVIVPALPKGALVEWHVVAQENQIQCNGMFEDSYIELSLIWKLQLPIPLILIGSPQSRSNQNLVFSSGEIIGVTQTSCLQKQQ